MESQEILVRELSPDESYGLRELFDLAPVSPMVILDRSTPASPIQTMDNTGIEPYATEAIDGLNIDQPLAPSREHSPNMGLRELFDSAPASPMVIPDRSPSVIAVLSSDEGSIESEPSAMHLYEAEIEEQTLSSRDNSPDLLSLRLYELFDSLASPDPSPADSLLQSQDDSVTESEPSEDDIEQRAMSSREESPDMLGLRLDELFDSLTPSSQLVTPDRSLTDSPAQSADNSTIESDHFEEEIRQQVAPTNEDENDRIRELIERIQEETRQLGVALQQQQIQPPEDNASSPSSRRSDSPDMQEDLIRLFMVENDTENQQQDQNSSPTEDVRYLFTEQTNQNITSNSNRSPSPEVCEGYEDFFSFPVGIPKVLKPLLPNDFDSTISEDCDDQNLRDKCYTELGGLYLSPRSRSSSRATHLLNDDSSMDSMDSPEHPHCRHRHQQAAARHSPSPPPPNPPGNNKRLNRRPRGFCCENNLHFHSPVPIFHEDSAVFCEGEFDTDAFERAFDPPNVDGNEAFLDYEIIEVSLPTCTCPQSYPTVHRRSPRIYAGYEDFNLNTSSNVRLNDSISSDEEFETPITPIYGSILHRVSVPLDFVASPPLEPAPRIGVYNHNNPLPNHEITNSDNRESLLEEPPQDMEPRERPGNPQTDTPTSGSSSSSHQETPPTREQPQHSYTGRERASRRERSQNQETSRARERTISREESPGLYEHLPPIRERSPPVRDRSPVSRCEQATINNEVEVDTEISVNLAQVTLTPDALFHDIEMACGSSCALLEASESPQGDEQNDQATASCRKRSRHSKKEAGGSRKRSLKSPKRKRSQTESQAPRDGSERLPPHGEQLPPQSEQFPPYGEQLPPQSEQFPPYGEQLPPQSEQFPPYGEQLPPQSEQLPPQSEQFPPYGEQLPPQSEQFPPYGEQLPPHSQQFPPHGEQLLPHCEQLPPHSEQLPPDGEQLPPNYTNLELRFIELFGSPSPPPGMRQETPAPPDADDIELEMIGGRMRSPAVGLGEGSRPRPASPLPLRSAADEPEVVPVRPQPLRAAEPCCLNPAASPGNDDQVLPSILLDDD